MTRQDIITKENKIQKIREAAYYKYLCKNQLLYKVIKNIQNTIESLPPNSFKYQVQRSIISQLNFNGIKSVLGSYGVHPFYTNLTQEGENFWKKHLINSNREVYNTIEEYLKRERKKNGHP